MGWKIYSLHRHGKNFDAISVKLRLWSQHFLSTSRYPSINHFPRFFPDVSPFISQGETRPNILGQPILKWILDQRHNHGRVQQMTKLVANRVGLTASSCQEIGFAESKQQVSIAVWG